MLKVLINYRALSQVINILLYMNIIYYILMLYSILVSLRKCSTGADSRRRQPDV